MSSSTVDVRDGLICVFMDQDADEELLPQDPVSFLTPGKGDSKVSPDRLPPPGLPLLVNRKVVELNRHQANRATAWNCVPPKGARVMGPTREIRKKIWGLGRIQRDGPIQRRNPVDRKGAWRDGTTQTQPRANPEEWLRHAEPTLLVRTGRAFSALLQIDISNR
jgi:hypothetical protein